MALKPLYLTIPETYGADELGLPYRDLVGEGVVGASDLAVTADGTDMTVDVATGACWIKGDDDANLQPTYRWYHDEAESLVIAAADVTNPRKDLVVAEVIDSSFGGGSDTARVRVITGTPAGAPAEPALPDNAIKLAVVDVPASDTTIAQAQITDRRQKATVGGELVTPKVRARMSGSQLIPNNAATAVQFAGTDDFDTDRMHDPASNNTRVTIRTPGLYAFLAGGTWATNQTGERDLHLRLNGTTIFARSDPRASGGGSTFGQVHGIWECDAGDYVELMAFQDSGGALNFGQASEETFLAAWRIG